MIEERGIRLSVDEGIGIAVPVLRFRGEFVAREFPRDQPVPVHAVAARRIDRLEERRARRGVRDEVARPPPGGEVIARDEFGIGQRHGDPADPEMMGELAARRHLLAGAEAAAQDALGHHLLNLLLQRAVEAGRQEEGFGGDRHGWPYRRRQLDLPQPKRAPPSSRALYCQVPRRVAPSRWIRKRPSSAPCRSRR